MARPTPIQRRWLFGFLLALVTLAIYWPVRHHDFINYDDDDYVYANDVVKAGLTWNGFLWSLGTHAVNWHPLTWLSHMLDCQLFGLDPGAPHLENVLIHCANAVLLLWLLDSLTVKFWRSAIVAALFALHPLRVESVAWVAERKDVLCAFFFLLTLLMYVRHVRAAAVTGKTGPDKDLRLALLFYVLALLSKPMVVTLPLILLLLDFWPLKRFRADVSDPISVVAKRQVGEKWPFFFLSVVFGGITWYAQRGILPHQGGGVLDLFQSTVVKYVAYIEKMFWPHDLSFLYVLHGLISGMQTAEAVLILAGITWLAWSGRRERPWLAVGWGWFLVMLLPVTMVQLPELFIADRYTYLPGIGFTVMIIWSLADLLERLPLRNGVRPLAAVIALAVLVDLSVVSRQQLAYWRDTEALLKHALAVDPNNPVAQINLRVYLFDKAHPEIRQKHDTRPFPPAPP